MRGGGVGWGGAKKKSVALTHIRLFTLETFSLAHTHTHFLHATLQMFFVAHAHIVPATLETSFLAHTHRRNTSCFEEAVPCKTQWNGTMGLQNPRDFQGAILT